MSRYPPFRTLDISFSNRCPLQCAHCLFAADMHYRGPTIPPVIAKRVIDEAADMETFTLLAAGSQEVFLDYGAFLDVVRYAHQEYAAQLTISTSCYWVKSRDHAERMFAELQQHGLAAVLVSLDRYHLEFVAFDKVTSALEALRALGIPTTVQTIYGRNDLRSADYQARLGQLADGDWIQFCELPAAPVGRGAGEPEPSLALTPGIPGGDCNIFEVLHIEPDGSVKPCCGAGLIAPGLTMGNIHQEALPAIAARMQIDPLMNSLRAWRGPAQLYRIATGLGLNDFQKPGYAGTCHACYELFSRVEVIDELRRQLTPRRVEFLASRWFAEHDEPGLED